jgi:hypothetical protein
MINDYNGPKDDHDLLTIHAPGEVVKGAILDDEGCPILVFESGDGIKFSRGAALDNKKSGYVSFEKVTAPQITSLIVARQKKIAGLTKEIERLGTLVRSNPGHQDRT